FGLSPNRVALSQRRFFVLHWPGGGVPADERQWMRNVERQHRNQGWSAAPGYNFCVGQSGTVYEGCGRDIRGVHSPPRNVDGFGICVMQPINAAASQAALNATRTLYDHLSAIVGRPLHISWHSAAVATACPGAQLVDWARAGMPATSQPQPQPEEDDMPQVIIAFGGGLYLSDLIHYRWIVDEWDNRAIHRVNPGVQELGEVNGLQGFGIPADPVTAHLSGRDWPTG
ncbi:MAG TPA: N-acetylmuramoyl-L-alanine amidase, partial [Acidimicrobiales bacterium]|nr:N-acetylmuramoyl-L-alanine amidase [Acidimicrobiales bacterium]